MVLQPRTFDPKYTWQTQPGRHSALGMPSQTAYRQVLNQIRQTKITVTTLE